jgi:cob(I)alamin adenosyltransferase
MDDLDAMLMRIQNDCFDLGADLATPDTGENSIMNRCASSTRRWTELRLISTLNADLEPLKSFVCPAAPKPPLICIWPAPWRAVPNA